MDTGPLAVGPSVAKAFYVLIETVLHSLPSSVARLAGLCRVLVGLKASLTTRLQSHIHHSLHIDDLLNMGAFVIVRSRKFKCLF